MRTKIIPFILPLLLALLLAACSALAEADATVNADSEAQEVLMRNDAEKASDKATWAHKAKYEIITETYIAYNETMDIAIRYPQIVNLGDAERQDRLNELIRKEAVPGQFADYDDSRLFTLPIDYKITYMSDNLLSVQYSGVGYVKGTPHPNHFFYTTNIDIARVKKVKLKDIVKIDEDFAEKFRSEQIKTVSPHPGALSGKEIFIDKTAFKTLSDTIRKLNDADKVDFKGRLPSFYCYLTPDSLGISADAPHFCGGHAEFEIRYEDVAGNIKAENPVWKDFFPQAGR